MKSLLVTQMPQPLEQAFCGRTDGQTVDGWVDKQTDEGWMED